MVNSREYGAQHDDNHRSRKGERSGCKRLGAGIVSNVRRQKNERDRQNGECDRHCWRIRFRGHDLLEFGLDQFVRTVSEMFRLKRLHRARACSSTNTRIAEERLPLSRVWSILSTNSASVISWA